VNRFVFRALVLIGAALLAASTTSAAAADVAGTLTEEAAKQDVRVLKRALTELHPALTKYRTEAEMNAAFAKFEARGNAARTAGETYLAATELAAAIRCGHTWTNVLNQAGATKHALLEDANKLPLTMTLVENRWLVLASADANVATGDEILAIDGVDAAAIVTRVMPYLRADGASDGKRLTQLNHDRADFSMMDIIWPLIQPPVNGEYTLQLRRANGAVTKANVKAMTLAARKAVLKTPEPNDAWQFRIDGNTGILTMPTFAFWRSKFEWEKFLDATFNELAQKNIPQLVIDIRRAEGGDGAVGPKLLSYLLKQPASYEGYQAISAYERAPYLLVKYLDTWDFDFFDRTGKVEKLGEKRYLYKARAVGPRTITPAANAFTGRVAMLVGAENSSATFQLAELTKRLGAATLIGQATGGNLRGLNGGELAWVTLPNSGVSVDIPLLSSVPLAPQPDASVTPDVVVPRTFAARAAGRDDEMTAAIRALQQTAQR
jgi:C-terminal processing protease CtpA/Prc